MPHTGNEEVNPADVSTAVMLATMNHKLTSFIDTQEKNDVLHRDHEQRIRSLEAKVWMAAGGAAAIGGGIGAAVSGVVQAFGQS